MSMSDVKDWWYEIDKKVVKFSCGTTKIVYMTFTFYYYEEGKWESTLRYYNSYFPKIIPCMKISRDELLERGLINA